MALFENFPYTNLHELNLDWLIQEMKELEEKVQDGPVVSVNGLTGEVVLYREAHIQLPDVTDSTITTWDIFRYLNGNIYGIQFDVNGNVYALKDNVRTKLLTWADIPADAGVISVNGLYGVVHLSGTDIPYMGGETETVYDKLSDLDDDLTSAQADINDLTITMGTIDNAIKRGIAFLESTDTAVNNIPAGSYVFWKNYAYISTSAISVGDTLSSTNLTAVATGGFINALQNALQTQINTLNSKIDTALEEVKIVQPVSNKFTLGNTFRGFLFASSAYANASGLMEVYSNSSGEVSTRIYFGTFSEITFDTSVNGELSYSTSRYVEMRLMRFE